MSPAPPAFPGLPLLGNFLEYRRDHVDVFWRAYEALGRMFSIRLGPQRAVVIIGPEHHRFFFSEVDRILSMPEMYRFVVPMFGTVLNAQPDMNVRRAQLVLMHSAMQGDRMHRHVAIMVQEISAWLETLGDSGEFEIYEALSGVAMKIAASAFMGREIRDRLEEFQPLYEDLARGMDFVLPPNLPLPRFLRRDRARRKLNELVRAVIAERRTRPDHEDDFLQALLDGRRADDGLRHEEDVVGFALMTVFTAYLTTAAQSCWTLIQLLENPEYLATVQAERASVLRAVPDDIGLDTLARLERLDWALKESQRMHPVMSHYARYNASAYDLGGYHVPRGWLTIVCPAVAHRLPDVFARPDVYDPERFSPARAEDKTPYSLIGFSEGLYKCPGARFGVNEMKCLVTLLLDRYTLRLGQRAPGRDFTMGIVRPRPPCRVRYTSRQRTGSRADVVPRRQHRVQVIH